MRDIRFRIVEIDADRPRERDSAGAEQRIVYLDTGQQRLTLKTDLVEIIAGPRAAVKDPPLDLETIAAEVARMFQLNGVALIKITETTVTRRRIFFCIVAE